MNVWPLHLVWLVLADPAHSSPNGAARDGAIELVEAHWHIYGLFAQAAIALCLLIHVVVSRRKGYLVFPPIIGYIGLLATLILLIYASAHREVVFMVGQFINMLICLRILTWLRQNQQPSEILSPRSDDDSNPFPKVAPDEAERRKDNVNP